MIDKIPFLISYSAGEFFSLACFFWAVHKIAFKLFNTFKNKSINIPEVLTCERCFAFWTVLILTFKIFDAAVVCVLVTAIEKIFTHLNTHSEIDINE